MKGKRAIILVLDGVGVGELPDADRYGDTGSNTLANTAQAVGGLSLPNFQRMGLGNILPILGVPPSESPLASYGKMAEKSAGKDTTTGHWEMAGIILDHPFPTFSNGFPKEIIKPFEAQIGRRILGNYAASGTEIIKSLGEEHLRTGFPIVYTSADSVFQIAAHKDVVPLDELYRYCQIARDLLQGPYAVGRVIARPFVGSPGNFTRTYERRDFSLEPVEETILDKIKSVGKSVIAVGKIGQIFAGRGVTEEIHTHGNTEGLQITVDFLRRDFDGLLMVNLVDFDMLYGHRNDSVGFAKALMEVDRSLPLMWKHLSSEDLFLITADHGVDPTTASTDHSREYVPLLALNPSHPGRNLGVRSCFCDLGASCLQFLGLPACKNGESFLK